MKQKEIDHRISAVWRQLGGNTCRIDKEAIIVAVLSPMRIQVAGKDKDLIIGCVRETVDRHVDKFFMGLTYSGPLKNPMTQEDFDFMQDCYVVNKTVVPAHLLTDPEFDQKYQEHDEQGAGHTLHAREIRIFQQVLRQKYGQQPAAARP